MFGAEASGITGINAASRPFLLKLGKTGEMCTIITFCVILWSRLNKGPLFSGLRRLEALELIPFCPRLFLFVMLARADADVN